MFFERNRSEFHFFLMMITIREKNKGKRNEDNVFVRSIVKPKFVDERLYNVDRKLKIFPDILFDENKRLNSINCLISKQCILARLSFDRK